MPRRASTPRRHVDSDPVEDPASIPLPIAAAVASALVAALGFAVRRIEKQLDLTQKVNDDRVADLKEQVKTQGAMETALVQACESSERVADGITAMTASIGELSARLALIERDLQRPKGGREPRMGG